MKILILAHRVCWPLKDGGTIGIYNFIKGLKEQGCEIVHLAINPVKFKLDMQEAARELGRFGVFRWVDADTGVKPLPALLNLFTSRSYNIERFRLEPFAELVKTTLEKEGPFDVIQFESSFVSLYHDLVRPLSKAKLVSHQHNTEYEIWQRLADNEKRLPKKWYLRLLARRLKAFEKAYLPRFDALLAKTPDDIKAYRGLGVTAPILLLPAGIDTRKYERGDIQAKPGTLCHIAFMEWLPNQESLQWFLDEVWPLVLEQHPSAEFYAAGMGMPDKFIRHEQEHVHISGETDDAAAFMCRHEVMVVPLLSGSGIRLKIIEGMAAGRPIVTTSVGLQGIEAADGRDILVGDSPQEFAGQVVRLLRDKQLSAEIAENGRAFARQHFSLNELSRKLYQFYQQLLMK